VLAVAVFVLVAAAAAIVALVTADRGSDPVDDAVELLEQERKFDASRQAVESFATVYEHLVEATTAYPKDCEVDRGRGRCLALNQAASWSLNVATGSGRCTQPAVQEGRLALLDYVTEASALDDAETEPPPLPSIPTC
jgi:hypothetical protein